MADFTKIQLNNDLEPLEYTPNTKKVKRSDASVDPERNQKRQKRVSRACVYCHRSHMSCEEARPCKRCVDRGIANLCKDLPPTQKKRGRKAVYLDDSKFLTTGVVKTANLNDQTTHINDTIGSKIYDITDNTHGFPLIEPPTTSRIPQAESEDILSYDLDLPMDLQLMMSELLFSPVEHSYASMEQKKYLDMEDPQYVHFMNVMKTRLPPAEDRETLFNRILQVRAKIRTYITAELKIPLEQIRNYAQLLKSDIEANIKVIREVFDKIGTPTIAWERGGSILYVNPSYRTITGFSIDVPTPPSEFSFYKQLSPSAFNEYWQGLLFVLSKYPEEKDLNAIMINCGIKMDEGKPGVLEDRFIDGVMSLTLKRDNIGLPFMAVGHFLPRVVQSNYPMKL